MNQQKHLVHKATKTNDGFRVSTDKREMPFNCLGGCNAEWDVYHLIMLRKNAALKGIVRVG
jgi:hypothetical protein